MFEWNVLPEVVVFAVTCKGARMSDLPTNFYVVTRDRRAVLPALPASSGIPVPVNRSCTWWVEVHGLYLTVDDATGPGGMLEPTFGPLSGPRRDNGTFTKSRVWN